MASGSHGDSEPGLFPRTTWYTNVINQITPKLMKYI